VVCLLAEGLPRLIWPNVCHSGCGTLGVCFYARDPNFIPPSLPAAPSRPTSTDSPGPRALHEEISVVLVDFSVLQVYAAADPVVCDKPGRLGLEASPEFYRSVSRSLCGVHTIVYALQSFPDRPRLLWTAGNPHTELDVSCMEVMGECSISYS
jgi:hypothetical protein